MRMDTYADAGIWGAGMATLSPNADVVAAESRTGEELAKPQKMV